MIFGLIILFSLLGSVGAILLAASFLLLPQKYQKASVPHLISFATGILLASAFLGLIPHALDHLPDQTALLSVLLFIILFFALEKLVVWHHCHNKDCPSHGRNSGLMILVGDAFHNFSDGVVIAASFLVSVPVGIIVSLSVLAHEIPQELGDFAILLHSGYSRKKAFWLNILSSLTTLPAAIISYFALSFVQGWIPYVMTIAAASFIYIALADLSPELHRRTGWLTILQQVLLMGIGVLAIILLLQFHHH